MMKHQQIFQRVHVRPKKRVPSRILHQARPDRILDNVVIRPLICMDETPRQLIRETRLPRPTAPGRIARYDYEYERCGVCNVFLAVEPLAGRRIVQVTERKTKSDWARFVERIARLHPEAEKWSSRRRSGCHAPWRA